VSYVICTPVLCVKIAHIFTITGAFDHILIMLVFDCILIMLSDSADASSMPD